MVITSKRNFLSTVFSECEEDKFETSKKWKTKVHRIRMKFSQKHWQYLQLDYVEALFQHIVPHYLCIKVLVLLFQQRNLISLADSKIQRTLVFEYNLKKKNKAKAQDSKIKGFHYLIFWNPPPYDLLNSFMRVMFSHWLYYLFFSISKKKKKSWIIEIPVSGWLPLKLHANYQYERSGPYGPICWPLYDNPIEEKAQKSSFLPFKIINLFFV